MKHKYFFSDKTSSGVYKEQECCIQIPSGKDIEQMHGMPAGANEDQYKRLKHMTQVITKTQSIEATLPVVTTDLVKLPSHWNQLFAAMNKGDTKGALALFAGFPEEDEILRALLAVHTSKYLQKIITDCIEAKPKGWKELNSDILITCDILMNSAANIDICHIDVFDSRVYPQQDTAFITKAFKKSAQDEGQKIHSWQREGLHYFAVDLSLTTRKPGCVHPALVFAIEKIEEQIKQAQKNGQKVALYFPTGWDSHEEETAYCGKYVDGHLMGATEARKTRFNEMDLTYFYESLFKLYQENKSDIERIYWGLEGGYEPKMYERQVKLLMSLILKDLVHQDTNQMVSAAKKA